MTLNDFLFALNCASDEISGIENLPVVFQIDMGATPDPERLQVGIAKHKGRDGHVWPGALLQGPNAPDKKNLVPLERPVAVVYQL